MTIDFEFRKKVMDVHVDADLIKYCYQCNKCTDNCPISYVTNDLYTRAYDPRENILNSILGYSTAILESDPIAIWGCTVCDTCDEVCPQHIELTSIFTLLKNESVKRGNAPDYIYAQARSIYESAKAIPSQSAIEKRRQMLGLPPVSSPNIEEVQTILKNIAVDKNLK